MSNEFEELGARGVQRRTLMKGAAWAAPAVALAATAPLASASVTTLSAVWGDNSTNVAVVNVLGGGSVLGADVLKAQVPETLTIVNGTGALESGEITGEIVVAPQVGGGLNLGGKPHGLAVSGVSPASGVNAVNTGGGYAAVLAWKPDGSKTTFSVEPIASGGSQVLNLSWSAIAGDTIVLKLGLVDARYDLTINLYRASDNALLATATKTIFSVLNLQLLGTQA